MKLGAPFGCNMCIIAVGGSFKMKKLFLALFSFILFFSLLWTVPIAASSLKLSVTPIYNTSKYVTGNATKGVHIIVRNAAKRVLATTVASKNNGFYKAKLVHTLKSGGRIWVYAKKNSAQYFYRIIHVQKSMNTTNKKTINKVTTYHISSPTGMWKSNNYKGWQIYISFTQKYGLSEHVYYKNKIATPIKNATYHVITKTPIFWEITAKHGTKKLLFYIRFTAKNKFVLVNKNNQITKTSIGKSPVTYYTFYLQH